MPWPTHQSRAPAGNQSLTTALKGCGKYFGAALNARTCRILRHFDRSRVLGETLLLWLIECWASTLRGNGLQIL